MTRGPQGGFLGHDPWATLDSVRSLVAFCVLLMGCESASLVDCAREPTHVACDAGLADQDAGPLERDAGPPGEDAGPPRDDAGPDVLVAETFDSRESFGARWQIDNHDAASFDVMDGRLVTGEGCRHGWICPRGPSIAHSVPSFPVGDGAFTVELEFWLADNPEGRAAIFVGVHNDVAVTWVEERNPELDPVDALFRLGATASFGHVLLCRLNCSDRRDWRNVVEAETWYRATLRSCAPGVSVEVTRMADGMQVVDYSNPAPDYGPRDDISDVYLQINAEGAGHLIDNITVRRGCD